MRNIRSRAVDVKKYLLIVMDRQCVLSKKLVSGGCGGIIKPTFYIYNGSTKRIKRWKHEKEKTYAVQPHLPHHGVCDGDTDDGKCSGDNRNNGNSSERY